MNQAAPPGNPHDFADRAEPASAGPIGLYLHFPYCHHHCWYCDFNVAVGTPADRNAYLAALGSEIVQVAEFADPIPQVSTVYVGGGTPSLAGATGLADLLSTVATSFECLPESEVSVEANPQDVTAGLLAALAAAGANRISLGVQAFADRRLGELDRAHSAKQAQSACELAGNGGFQSVSLDLIYGTPGQSLAAWRGDLERAADLPINHISCYALTLDSPRARRRAQKLGALVDGDRMSEFYHLALAVLGQAGFIHYESSNWARPGFSCRHNSNVWAGRRYLPLGCGGHGFIGNRRYHLVRDPRRYQKLLKSGQSVVAGSETLAPADLLLEALTLPLRTAAGLDAKRLARQFDYDLFADHGERIAELAKAGLLTVNGSQIAPTDYGMYLADGLGAALLPSAAIGR